MQAPHGEMLQEFYPQEEKILSISPETLTLIKEALWGVVNSPGGTGGRARVEGFDVAGKTGTAQVIQRKGRREEYIEAEFKDHAWFACFAPLYNPQITVVVLVEHGGHGGAVAAPMARQVLAAYYGQKKRVPEQIRVAQKLELEFVEKR